MPRTLVFISLESWDDVWRRNQFICAELGRRDPQSRVLFVAPPRDLSHAVRRRDLSALRSARSSSSWSPDGMPHVVVFTPTKWLPNSLAIGRAFNAWAMRRQVAREANRLGMRSPVLWINDHSAGHLAGRLDARGVVYDVTDDWVSFYPPSRIRDRVRVEDAHICAIADATIVCSRRLYDVKRPLVGLDQLHLVPNGVDADHYAAVSDRSLPLPDVAREWPSPVFGYTGTVHPDRVDLALVERSARSLKAGCIALVGPNHLSAADRARLSATGRVFMTGPVAYRDVPAYMRAFDVCIVPHRVSAFTESLNPIKLWEYLAAGLPIVSTDVAGFRDFPHLVHIVPDADSFASAMREAVGEDASFGICRRDEARGHSWASRVDEIESVLDRAVRHAEATRGR